MTIEELKRALVEVKRICVKNNCCRCPFHNTAGAVYCPMNPYDSRAAYPSDWDDSEWKEDTNG